MIESRYPLYALGRICRLITDGSHFSPTPREEGHPIVNAKDIPRGKVNLETCTRISEADFRLLKAQNCAPEPGDVLLSKDGTIGRVVHYNQDMGVVLLSSVAILRPDGRAQPAFLAHALRSDFFDRQLFRLQSGSALKRLVLGDIRKIEVPLPDHETQRRISEILGTMDEAIEQTEALIAKQQQMKTGLMHDLFTRGVAESGQLRPPPAEAPHLYHMSSLGLIPKQWQPDSLGNLAESLIDGPFGSNLKTEHYVIDPGVRVVRLQNIEKTSYDDTDKAFISEAHADYLSKNQVVGGDVLVAGLGDETYPVGRACCYPLDLPPATNKADCFRLRCRREKMLNAFAMFFLNTATARFQVRRYEQGVTRRRINTGNMKKIVMGVPSRLGEQAAIVDCLEDAIRDAEATIAYLAKLRQLKQGLMQDLLTGRVPVAAA